MYLKIYQKFHALYQNLFRIKSLSNTTNTTLVTDAAALPSFDKTILIGGLLNIYTRDLLLQEKNKIIALYDQEIKIQKELSETLALRHSAAHRDAMRNIEILLDNLSKINNALTALDLYDQDIISTHIKKLLEVNSITSTKLKRK